MSMRKGLNKLGWVILVLFLVGLSLVGARTELSTARTNLTIWDSTDTNASYINTSIYFYVNYTNATGVSINSTGINCSIKFNHTGTWSNPVNMTFNTATLLYEYNATITTRFGSYYNISCVDPTLGYDNLSLTEALYVNNSKPTTPLNLSPVSGAVFSYIMNITCNGTTDLEGDQINYSVTADIINESLESELRVLITNLTNTTYYIWNVTNLTSQRVTLSCLAYDGYDYSGAITSNPVIDRSPSFSGPIENMTWLEDTVNSSINLSQHFYDIDGDDLNYTYVGASNITVSINNDTGIVSLTPHNNFYGNNSIIFYAWDGYGPNASSNNVTLEIINTPEVNLSSPVDGSDGYYADTAITFKITINDDYPIDNCSLYINGTLNQTNTDIKVGTAAEAGNDTGTPNSYDPITAAVDSRKKTLNLSNQTYTGFKAYLKRTGSPGELIVKINGYNKFNISESDVSSTVTWVNKVLNDSILVEGINNITFQNPGYVLFANYYELGKDANGEYMVRFTNDAIEFDPINLSRGYWQWNATCTNNQSQSAWSAETWSLTVNNSAPEAPTNISPESGTFDKQINVSCWGSTDIDGDNLTYVAEYSHEDSPTSWDTMPSSGDGNFTLDTSGLPGGKYIKLRCYSNDGDVDSTYNTQSTFNILIDHQGAPSVPTNLTCNNGLCTNQSFGDEIILNCSGSTDSDSNFNFTFEAYYTDYDGSQWRRIGSVVNQSDYGNYTWNTSSVINQSDISIRCYSDDGINSLLGYLTKENITIGHANSPNTPINFNYSTDYKHQVNITANGSTDPNGDSILYRVWAYYDSSWHNINDTLTNETVFNWGISSIGEGQDIELKCQATDGTYYSDFITAPAITISREPTTPTNLTPESGNYEYEINYSCSGSNNTNYFVYYIDAYYDGSWNGLTEAFPGIPPVNDSELAYEDGDYNEILNQPANDNNYWRYLSINVSNGNYSYCVRGYGTGNGPRFKLYWDCDADGTSCSSDGSYTDLISSDAIYCSDIELTKSGLKYLKIQTYGDGTSNRIDTHFNHAYLVSKPFTWNVTNINRQTGVDLRCLANDAAGNSSWFNPSGVLSINRVPRWNSSANTSYSGLSYSTNHRFNLTDWFYDIDGDVLNFSATNTAYTTATINGSNLTITPSGACDQSVSFNVVADDNISQTTQEINLSFTACPVDTRDGGGGGGTTVIAAIIEAIEEFKEAITEVEEEEEAEEPPPAPPPPVERKRRDEITEKIIEKRFSVKRNMVVGYGQSQITETITNIDLYQLEDVRVRITIPKDVVRTTDGITLVTPFRIIQRDPIIEFSLGDIPPYQEAEIVYVINNELTREDLNRITIEIIPKDLTEEERLRREQEIEEKIEETSKVIEITREVEINKEEEKTTYTIDIDFKEESVLYNVSIFEEIPKCLVEIIQEELIDSDFEFEIVSADPLIVWHFDKLTKEQRIQYSIKQLTEEDCANKAKSVALAQQIILITQRYSPRKASLSLLPVPIILLILIFFTKFGEARLHEEEHVNKLVRYTKSQYKKGRTEEDVKTTLLLHGHKDEDINDALNLNARNRLHHWLVRLEIGIEEIILLFIIGLSILDFLEILPGDLDFLKKLVSWVLLGYLIYKVSPTSILFGHKSKTVDLGLISGYFMLIMKDLVNFTRNFDVTSEVYYLRDLFLYINRHEVLFESYFFISGIVLLILVTICVALRFEIKQPSLMALLHVTGHLHKKREFITRFIIAHLLTIGFFIVVFNLLTEWLAIAVDAPIITAAIFVYIFVLVKHKNRLRPVELLYKIGNVGEKFYERFIDLFHYKKTLLLGLAGMKLLHQITDIGNFIIPYTVGLTDPIYFGSLGVGHNAIFSLFNSHSLFAAETLGMALSFKLVLALTYMFNITAMVILLSLPALLWYHMYKYRELPVSKVPTFKLRKPIIVLFFTSITVFLTAPAFRIGHIKGEGLVGVDVTTQSIAGFGNLHLLLAVAAIAGALSCLFCYTGLKKYLKRIVVVSALAFFAYYTWHYFANVVIYFIEKIMLLLDAQPFITTYLIMFLFVNIVFYLSGFTSYFIELFLRNELGFKAFVEREWLGILGHHDMHHIHYSDAHDEEKHGKEVDALIRFMENEIAHSLRPIKTIDKLAHHGWSLDTIKKAVIGSGITERYAKPMLDYIAKRKERVRSLRGYIARYQDFAPIKKLIRNAVKSGWSREDIRLAMHEV